MPPKTNHLSAGSYSHEYWSSRLGFVLAATGSAVGLGNIWKFPYIAGENGGGAFVLIYLLCVMIIGVPVMMAEALIGRRGGQSPVHSYAVLAAAKGASPSHGLRLRFASPIRLWRYWQGSLFALRSLQVAWRPVPVLD